jgi:hypothetical protein
MPKLTIVRADCADTPTCPVIALPDVPDGDVRIVGRPITDPDELAQLPIGPGEIAIAFPSSLLPEVISVAAH